MRHVIVHSGKCAEQPILAWECYQDEDDPSRGKKESVEDDCYIQGHHLLVPKRMQMESVCRQFPVLPVAQREARAIPSTQPR